MGTAAAAVTLTPPLGKGNPAYAANPDPVMTVSAPFPAKRCRNPSIYIDPDMLDAIDVFRVSENDERPLSRSAMVRNLWSAPCLTGQAAGRV